jgi:hypothetical protein
MSTLRGVGGKEVLGATPVNGVTAGQGGRTKKRHRGGKNRKRPKPTPAPEPEQSADSTSGAEAGSESSVHGYYAAIEKVTGKLSKVM